MSAEGMPFSVELPVLTGSLELTPAAAFAMSFSDEDGTVAFAGSFVVSGDTITVSFVDEGLRVWLSGSISDHGRRSPSAPPRTA